MLQYNAGTYALMLLTSSVVAAAAGFIAYRWPRVGLAAGVAMLAMAGLGLALGATIWILPSDQWREVLKAGAVTPFAVATGILLVAVSLASRRALSSPGRTAVSPAESPQGNVVRATSSESADA